MKKASNIFAERRGFSLAEVLTALVIASMVLVTVLGIYSRAESVSATITRKLEDSRMPSEVLQLIAEDLDKIITTDAGTTIKISNKYERGYSTAQLTILKTIVDSKKQSKIFENIIWQTNYDYETNSLVLYRHRISEIGLLEDKLLEAEREVWEQGLFVPICSGITFFKIQAVNNGQYLDKWSGRLPPGIEISISFAEPFEALDNSLEVYDDQKFTRSIAIDRTRLMKFKVIQKKPESPEESTGLEKPEESTGLEELEELADVRDDANQETKRR